MRNDCMHAEALRNIRARGLLVFGIGTALAVTAAVDTKMPAVFFTIVFNTVLFASPFWVARIKPKKSDRKIDNGGYFRLHSPEQIIGYGQQVCSEV